MHKVHLALAAAAAVAACPASGAYAQAVASSGIENAGTPVPDAALGEMRGKYIGPGNITYFGVQMQTSLQRPDGVTTAATLQLNVNLPNAGSTSGAASQVLVSWSHDGDSTMDVPGQPAGTVLVNIPAGLGSVQGAVQSQQIGGDGNHVSNGMTIAVVPSAMVTAGSSDGTEISGSESHAFNNGDSLQFVADSGKVGIVMSGGTDQVRQMVDGSIGQAAQNVILNSSGNDVRNSMGITIGYDPAAAAAVPPTLQSGLSGLHGWGY